MVILVDHEKILAMGFVKPNRMTYFRQSDESILKSILVFLWSLFMLCSLQGQTFQRCNTTYKGAPQGTVSSQLHPREIIEIPIVFHVVWHTEEDNISDDFIFSQLDVLNADYNAQNEDIDMVPEEFKNVVGNASISFCLATMTPKGAPSSGIVRKQTDKANIAGQDQMVEGLRSIKNKSLGGSNAWDTKRYLNIWIGARNDGLIGDATFPRLEDPNQVEGIVISYKAVGIQPHAEKFNLGRTLTHEIGHYFNLLHLTGSETGCYTDGDFVEDTPTQFDNYFGACQNPVYSCGSRDMDLNFMSFRDDPCLVFFTKGQVQRMRETLFTIRYGLVSSRICGMSVPIPNDPLKVAQVYMRAGGVEVALPTLINREYTLELYDVLGRILWKRNNNPAHRYQIQYSNHIPGIYFLRLNLEDKTYIKKIYLN